MSQVMDPHDAEVLADLAHLGVATIYEAAGRRGLLDAPFTQVVPGSRVAGPARTVACGPGDNRAVHEAMAHVAPGEVLVLAMPEATPCALVGELLATQAATRGAAAILLDAAVRDWEALQALGLPIWTRFVRATGATKDHRGALDVPVVVAGTEIAPGDTVVLDADGAVVVPAARLREVHEAARARLAKEEAMRQRFEAGELSYDIYGMRAADEGGAR